MITDTNRKIIFSHEQEKQVAQALDAANVEYAHDSESQEQELDFFLPKYNIFIEVKFMYREKVEKQLSKHRNVILLQGQTAVDAFCALIALNPNHLQS